MGECEIVSDCMMTELERHIQLTLVNIASIFFVLLSLIKCPFAGFMNVFIPDLTDSISPTFKDFMTTYLTFSQIYI